MARVHVMGGYLNVEGMSGGYPGNELPGGEGTCDPGYGISSDRPSNPIVLPPQPPQVWPPISVGTRSRRSSTTRCRLPPGTIWPSPGRPPHIDAGCRCAADPGSRCRAVLPGGGRATDNTLPATSGVTGRADRQRAAIQTFWMLCYAPSLGWKYVSVGPVAASWSCRCRRTRQPK